MKFAIRCKLLGKIVKDKKGNEHCKEITEGGNSSDNEQIKSKKLI